MSRPGDNRPRVGDFEVERPRRPRQKQKRNWRNYNLSQEVEQKHVIALLAHMSALLGQPEYIFGRPEARLSDILFASVLKNYLNLPFRKLQTPLDRAFEDGLIESPIRWPTLNKYLADPGMTDIYQTFVGISALPCRQVETSFVIDATGFGTGMYDWWYDEKYGRKKRGDKQWVKSHRMIATRTLSVVSAAVSEGTVHDTNLFPELLETTAKVFTVEEIAADKGYISHRNLKLVDDLGAIPYIPFKKNYLVPLNVTNSIWNRMVRLYVYQRDEFDAHYTTPRNKVEGSISVDKRVGGPNLSASTRPGQFNESFCRLIAYNLARLVRVHYTSQDLIDVVDFGQLEPVYFNSEPLILPSQHAAETAVGLATPQCTCPVCQGTVNPFWTLPGRPNAPTHHNSGRNGASRNGTSDPVPDNVTYLFGRPNSPVN